MKHIDFDKAFAPVPEAFIARTQATLDQLEERKMKKTTARAVLLAAVIAVMVAGAALALTEHLGISDFFAMYRNPLTPLEGAERMIARDLGQAANDRVRVTLKEAVYDGRNLRVLALVEPLDESLWLMDEAGDVDEGMAHARPAGKTVLGMGEMDLMDEEACVQDVVRMSVNQEGSVTCCLAGVTDAPQDRLDLTLTLSGDAGDLQVPFALRQSGAATAVILTPERQALPQAGATVHAAQLRFTPLVGSMTVSYTLAPLLPAQLAGTDTVYQTGKGRFFHRLPGCAGMENAAATAYSEALAQGKNPCPLCIAGAPNEQLQFQLLDQAGNPIPTEGGAQYVEETPDGLLVRQECLIQTTDRPAPAYALRAYNYVTGEVFDTVACRAG